MAGRSVRWLRIASTSPVAVRPKKSHCKRPSCRPAMGLPRRMQAPGQRTMRVQSRRKTGLLQGDPVHLWVAQPLRLALKPAQQVVLNK